ncbi:TPA: hypothetical protein ACVU5C_002179 [Vibrio parahaemolyticus]
MRLSNKQTYKLSDIDAQVPIADKLRKCVELGIPVFVPLPSGFQVWAIDPQLESLSKSDVILSEPNILKKAQLIRHFVGEQEFDVFRQPNVNTSELCSSTLLCGVEFLQLKTEDAEKLVVSERISVRNFAGVFMFDRESKDYKLCHSLPVSKYVFDVDDCHQTAFSNVLSRFLVDGVDLTFTLCTQNSIEGVKFNHPVEYIQDQEILISACEILERDVAKYLFNETDYQRSIYHLEPEYHVSTAFVELSKAGFLAYVKRVPIVSGGVSSFIGRNCPSFKTNGSMQAGAALIATEARCRSKHKGCLFPELKKVFDTHWVNKHQLKRVEAKRNIVKVTHALEALGLSSYYVKAAEKIIRPDQYKKS